MHKKVRHVPYPLKTCLLVNASKNRMISVQFRIDPIEAEVVVEI